MIDIWKYASAYDQHAAEVALQVVPVITVVYTKNLVLWRHEVGILDSDREHVPACQAIVPF